MSQFDLNRSLRMIVIIASGWCDIGGGTTTYWKTLPLHGALVPEISPSI